MSENILTSRWRVHIVTPGEEREHGGRTYTESDAREHGHDLPLVEFFDAEGRFRRCYYASTLLGIGPCEAPPAVDGPGLCLDADDPEAFIDGEEWEAVASFLKLVAGGAQTTEGGSASQGAGRKPECRLSGENANVFNLLGIAGAALRRHGMRAEADEMCGRVFSCDGYDEALTIIGEYVEIT